jgi:serine protease inhibitor
MGHGRLDISAVLQKGYVDVNKHEPESTAATAVAFASAGIPKPPPPVVFRVDFCF